MEKILYSGKLMKLEYETKSDVFVPARRQRDYYEIPANALQYTYHKPEPIADRKCEAENVCAACK